MAQAPTAGQAARGSSWTLLAAVMATEQHEATEPFAERYYTVGKLAAIWNLSSELVRQIV